MKFPRHKDTLVPELWRRLKKMQLGWANSCVITVHFKTIGVTLKPLSTDTPGHFWLHVVSIEQPSVLTALPFSICPSSPHKPLIQPGIGLHTHGPCSLCFLLLTLGSNFPSWFSEKMATPWAIFLRSHRAYPFLCSSTSCAQQGLPFSYT